MLFAVDARAIFVCLVRMIRIAILLALLLSLMTIPSTQAADGKVYELRVYYSPEGKLDTLHARFRDHTMKLFEKHGIENIGYWVPVDNKENKLIYLIAYPTREAGAKAWKEFFADPDWQKAQKESEANGKIVAKVQNYFLQLTDFSPVPKADASGNRLFEFRTYTTPEGRLENLDARFRDHTLKLFENHGMQNIAYFHLMPDDRKDNAKPGLLSASIGAQPTDSQPPQHTDEKVTLFYLLAHKDKAARDASFDAFRKDLEWQRVLKASEEKAGGSLTIKDGVKSEFYKATDYSPIK
jgi:hypothetical protein